MLFVAIKPVPLFDSGMLAGQIPDIEVYQTKEVFIFYSTTGFPETNKLSEILQRAVSPDAPDFKFTLSDDQHWLFLVPLSSSLVVDDNYVAQINRSREWFRENATLQGKQRDYHSYALKHRIEAEPPAIYVSNGACIAGAALEGKPIRYLKDNPASHAWITVTLPKGGLPDPSGTFAREK